MDRKRDYKKLSLLKPNHAGAMRLKDGSTANYGVIRIERDSLVYYTGKGLREIWEHDRDSNSGLLNLKAELDLIRSKHINIIRLDDIDRVIF
jgi:hypothetical protein